MLSATAVSQARTRIAPCKRVVVDKADPLAEKRGAKRAAAASPATGRPSFGEIADGYVETKGGQWKSAKHRQQWAMTLTRYCASIRELPCEEDQGQARGAGLAVR